MDITKRVRAYSKRSGKSQNQIAKDLGISAAHLSFVLRRMRVPSRSLAVAIETMTGVPARAFLAPLDRLAA